MMGPTVEPVEAPEQPGTAFPHEDGPNRRARRLNQRKAKLRAKHEQRVQRMLETCDVRQARIFWHQGNHRLVEDHELLTGLHKLRLERPGIADELRAESLAWLGRNVHG